MSLSSAIGGVRTMLGNVSGLTRVYTDPPESISEFPAAIVYSREGEYHGSAAGGHSLHTIIIEIYHARQHLPQAVDEAKQWPGKIYTAVAADITLGGTVSHVVYPLRYRSMPLRYNESTHFGVRFELTAKINE